MTVELPVPKAVAPKLRALYEAWKDVDANERASFQTWFLQLCDALGVPAPTTPTGVYRFELPAKVVDREGELATNFIDAWHRGHFAMEAKMSEPGKQTDVLLRKDYGRVRHYASHLSGTPVPYLMVVDVPRTLMIWDRWSGSYSELPWKTMDEGGMFGAEMLHRFNGHFFKTREALPLEPSIFGTLLLRALDPEERQRIAVADLRRRTDLRHHFARGATPTRCSRHQCSIHRVPKWARPASPRHAGS